MLNADYKYQMKKYRIYILPACIILLFLSLIIFRDNMIEYISESRSSQIPDSVKSDVAERISEEFDYSRNGLGYSCTFLEFGSTGCSACRQMQAVMETVRSEYPEKVNVVFINTANAGNLDMADYYGIVTIPTQVLLDRSGKEYYRHSGYISAEELSVHFK